MNRAIIIGDEGIDKEIVNELSRELGIHTHKFLMNIKPILAKHHNTKPHELNRAMISNFCVLFNTIAGDNDISFIIEILDTSNNAHMEKNAMPMSEFKKQMKEGKESSSYIG